MKNKSIEKILSETDGGLKLFSLLLPELKMIGDKNKMNIDSPISKGKKCFSVYKSNGRYLFKDHFTKGHGDIFELVAQMHNLSSKTDFPKVLEIIENLLNENHAHVPENQKLHLCNTHNEGVLTLMSAEYSQKIVTKSFMKSMPFLDNLPSYPIQVVYFFEISQVDKNLSYSYDYSKPEDFYYAIVIKPEQYYILFNPKTGKSYEWGQEPEFYVFGIDKLFEVFYCDNIYLRENIVVTNTMEGALWCIDKGLPCIGLINNKTSFPDYFIDVILPKFPHRFLLLDLRGNNKTILDNLISYHDFENIITGEIYLTHFFREKDKALDMILNRLNDNDDYKYIGLSNFVKVLDETEVQA